MRIVCDCDGVLTNFVGEVGQLFRKSSDWAPSKREIWEELEISEVHFWEIIRNEGTDFWTYMRVYPNTLWFTNMLYKLSKGKFILASAPFEDEMSYTGRVVWALNSGIKYKGIYLGDKSECADSNTLLIDDDPSICHKFVKAGGYAYLYRRPWNYPLIYEDTAESAFAHINKKLFQLQSRSHHPKPKPME